MFASRRMITTADYQATATIPPKFAAAEKLACCALLATPQAINRTWNISRGQVETVDSQDDAASDNVGPGLQFVHLIHQLNPILERRNLYEASGGTTD